MISGSFHALSQEWRYFSREKSIVHTLHLSQLVSSVTGQAVIISPVPPTGTGNNAGGFSAGFSGTIITPYRNVQWLGSTGYYAGSYGGLAGFDLNGAIFDGLNDWSIFRYTPHPTSTTQNTVGFAAPARLGGGPSLVMGFLNLAFPGINVGTSVIETNKLVLATASLPNGSEDYKPPNYQVVNEGSNLLYGVGAGWSTNPPGPMPQLNVIYPGTFSMVIIDNLTTGTLSLGHTKYAVLDEAPEVPFADYLPLPSFFECLWIGPMNF